jgi:serine/tyrosine/threonine adenylyltransferase
MDHYDPAAVFSSIDELGRYAYANQPRIALWNLTRFAECLLPLLADNKENAIEQAQFILGEFPERFTAAYQAGLRRKTGLFTERDGDEALIQDLLDAMAKNRADFTLTFRRLGEVALEPARDQELRQLFADPAACDEWAMRWRRRLEDEPQSPAERALLMRSVNPAFIPRNHRIEAVIQAAVSRDDYAPFEELLEVLSKPYEDQSALSAYADPPEPHQRVLQTFCGT